MTKAHFSLIDTHAHLTSQELYPHIEEIVARAKMAHVSHVVNINTDKDCLEKGLLLHEKYPWIVNAAATPPQDIDQEGEKLFPFFAKAAKEKKIVAIGETGLDYFYKHSSKEEQKKYLGLYFTLANECNLPAIIHCRDGFADLFPIADEHFSKGTLILHCFTGTQDEAEKALSRGWYISFSGIVTFPKSISLQEVAKTVPLNRLLIETDSPYLAPQSHRGKQNEPAYVVEVAQKIALLKNVDIEDVVKATTENALRLFYEGFMSAF